MAILPIRLYPDEILRAPAEEVTDFGDGLRRLAADMVETMHAAPGIGLAAPQVGVGSRLIVVDLSVGEEPDALRVLVNPRIVAARGRSIEVEGCLSIPEITDKVERPAEIEIEAADLDGRPVAMAADDWLARAICHEVDHLDGVLFVDRLRGLRRQRMERRLRKLLAGSGGREWSSGAGR